MSEKRIAASRGNRSIGCSVTSQASSGVLHSVRKLPADLVLLAMGFVHPVHEGLLKDLRIGLDERGNVRADSKDFQTSIPRVYAAGDMRRGQSLVVWAIREGRQCARAVDEFLMGSSELPG